MLRGSFKQTVSSIETDTHSGRGGSLALLEGAGCTVGLGIQARRGAAVTLARSEAFRVVT